MLVFLDLLHNAVCVGDSIGEYGLKIFYVEHCDCVFGDGEQIEVGCWARRVGLTCFGLVQFAVSCECLNHSGLARYSISITCAILPRHQIDGTLKRIKKSGNVM